MDGQTEKVDQPGKKKGFQKERGKYIQKKKKRNKKYVKFLMWLRKLNNVLSEEWQLDEAKKMLER